MAQANAMCKVNQQKEGCSRISMLHTSVNQPLSIAVLMLHGVDVGQLFQSAFTPPSRAPQLHPWYKQVFACT